MYKSVFVCVGAIRRIAETRCLRPVFCVDGAFCKPPWSSGQLLMATTWDANDNVLLLGYAHVAVEDTENYQWFFCLLKQMLPQFTSQPGLVVLTDGQKGLRRAVRTTLPGAAHCLCAHHLEAHVLPKYNAGERNDLRLRYWGLVKVSLSSACLPLSSSSQSTFLLFVF